MKNLKSLVNRAQPRLHALAPARRYGRNSLLCLVLLGALAPTAHAQQNILTNGGFETGYLSGWTTASAGDGGFQLGTTLNDGNGHFLTPGTQSYSAGPLSAKFYAVSDASDPVNGGPGARALLQTFTIAPGSTNIFVQFNMFVNDYNGAGALNVGGALDPTQSTPTQYARVDILTGSAPALSTDPADVLMNLYEGVDAGNPPNFYRFYRRNVTTLLQGGGTFQLRFAEVDNQFVINQGVDLVSVFANAPATVTPEPDSLALLGGCVLAGGLWRTRRRRR